MENLSAEILLLILEHCDPLSYCRLLETGWSRLIRDSRQRTRKQAEWMEICKDRARKTVLERLRQEDPLLVRKESLVFARGVAAESQEQLTLDFNSVFGPLARQLIGQQDILGSTAEALMHMREGAAPEVIQGSFRETFNHIADNLLTPDVAQQLMANNPLLFQQALHLMGQLDVQAMMAEVMGPGPIPAPLRQFARPVFRPVPNDNAENGPVPVFNPAADDDDAENGPDHNP
jgi:hypothetical protein